MAQEVTIDAAAMASSIADTGSVAIYGINFDTAKSGIKPESEPGHRRDRKTAHQQPRAQGLYRQPTGTYNDRATRVPSHPGWPKASCMLLGTDDP